MKNEDTFTTEDARRFAQRHGMNALKPEQMELLASAMTKMFVAGQTVARAPSKFVAPAHVFRVRPAQR